MGTTVTVTISRWGNSLGLRIPKTAAHDAQLSEGDRVDVAVESGRLVVRKASRPVLAELVARITPENRYGEEIPSTVGGEAW